VTFSSSLSQSDGEGTARRSRVVEGSAQNPSTIETSFDGPPPHAPGSSPGSQGGASG